MEFPQLLPLMELFPDQISIVQSDLIPKKSPAVPKYGNKMVMEHVTEILNKVGIASAKAQDLKTVITSAKNLQSGAGRQTIYLVCDFASNRVVGLLKIGVKHLFLFDQQGKIYELNPLCVLDFYVHETMQRRGYGKILFDIMLEHERIAVNHLSIDLPSDSFIYFLRKHYALTHIIPQVNHFVIYDSFFNSRSDLGTGKNKSEWLGLDQVPTPEKENRKVKVAKRSVLQDARQYNKDISTHHRHHDLFRPEVGLRNGNNRVMDQRMESFY